MKALIIRLNLKLSIEANSAGSIEAIYLREYLLKQKGYSEVYFCDKKVRDKNPNYIDLFDTDFNEYDSIFITNSALNFFGGVVKDEVIEKVKKVANFNGEIYYVLCDPKLFLKNTAEKIKDRNEVYNGDRLSKEDADKFTEKISKSTLIFTGSDYSYFAKQIENKEKKYYVKLSKIEHWPLFEFLFVNYKFNEENLNNEKEFDLVYYGSDRGSYRNKIIEKYFNNDILKTNIVGFNKEFKNNTCFDFIHNDKLANHINKSLGSLIIGDKEHNSNWITYRFFEGILSGVILFIDEEYDINKNYLKNPILQKICYVKSAEDIKKRLDYIKDNNLYNQIIKLQKEELKRYNYLKY
jgi:hypothetical protein